MKKSDETTKVSFKRALCWLLWDWFLVVQEVPFLLLFLFVFPLFLNKYIAVFLRAHFVNPFPRPYFVQLTTIQESTNNNIWNGTYNRQYNLNFSFYFKLKVWLIVKPFYARHFTFSFFTFFFIFFFTIAFLLVLNVYFSFLWLIPFIYLYFAYIDFAFIDNVWNLVCLKIRRSLGVLSFFAHSLFFSFLSFIIITLLYKTSNITCFIL